MNSQQKDTGSEQLRIQQDLLSCFGHNKLGIRILYVINDKIDEKSVIH